MARSVLREDTSLDEAPRYTVDELVKAVQSLVGAVEWWAKLARETLEHLGVRRIVGWGQASIGGLRVLGRGWSSIVFLAELGDGTLAAVKLLAPWSRRTTLLWEAALLVSASAVDIAPRVYSFNRYAIAMKPLLGPKLASYTPRTRSEACILLRRLFWKARLLDHLHIRHNELARPGGQVLLDEHGEPYIVDYESATIASKPSNVTQLYGGLQKLEWARQLLSPPTSQNVRLVLREYKRNPTLDNWERLLQVVLRC